MHLGRLTPLTLLALATACTAAEQKPAASTAAAPQELALHAVEYAFHGADTVSAGMTTIKLTNGGKELHHVQLVRLDSGKTIADLQNALKKPGPFPAWAALVPGPNAPDPGSTSNITVDLAAGSYAVICMVDVPGGVPHFAKGMIKPLIVKASTASTVAAPTADVTVTLADYAFTLDKALTAGKHVIKVVSNGPQPHEVEIVKFAPGKTLDDLGKWMAKPEGPPPANAIGGTSAQMPGTTPTFEVDLAAGDYAMICFIPDAKDGKPHLMKGMVHNFKIG